MNEKKHLTYEELINATPDDLSIEDLTRRISLTSLKKAERELELVESQNAVFQDKKVDAKRVADTKTTIIAEEQNRIDREQNGCKHKTGGKGLAGFWNGDGKWGASVCSQELPTGEVYFLCVRCQKEWRLPSKRDVLEGKITLAEYRAREAKYYEVNSWDKPMFNTDSGEVPGSVKFYIPKLVNQKVKDDEDFAAYLQEIGATTHAQQ